MSKYINLPTHSVGQNELYLNGRKLENSKPLTLKVKGLTPNKYNIDFLLECGSAIEVSNINVTSSTEGINVIVTDVPGRFESDDDLDLGRNKVVQVVAIKDTDSIVLNISSSGTNYTINISIDKLEEDQIITLIPNFKTLNDISYFPNGVMEYPSSNFDLPLPILESGYKVSWLDGNKAYELNSTTPNVNLYYLKSSISIEDLGEEQEVTDANNVLINLADPIVKTSLNSKSYLIPFVAEFVKDDYIVSSRVVLLARMYIGLEDEWKRPLEKLFVPMNTTPGSKNRYTLKSLTPNVEILDTPYTKWWDKNGVSGISRLSKNAIKYTNEGYTEENEDIDFICTRDTENDEGYTLNVNYTPISDTIGFMLDFKIRDVNIGNQRKWITVANQIQGVTSVFDQSTNLTIEKYKSAKFNFTANNIAKLKFGDKTVDTKIIKSRNIETVVSGIRYSYTVNESYGIELGPDRTAYPELTGTITLDASKAIVGNYELTISLCSYDDTVLDTKKIKVNVKRPAAVMSADFDNKKLNVDIDKGIIIPITCKNVYSATVKNSEILTKMSATIENANGEGDLQENGTYSTYTFNLKIEPRELGTETIVLLLEDDQSDIELELRKPIDIYTTKYTPINSNANLKDYKQGLAVRHSYNEKINHRLPLAFVSGGEVADYILVCKYPISQDTFDKSKDDKKNVYISKANSNRLEYLADSKVSDNEGAQGGELYKVANPNITKPILKSIKDNGMLNGKAYPIGDSIYLDTMLANLTDAHYLACLENDVNDQNVNWYKHNRRSFFGTDLEALSYYPELPLKPVEGTKGGTWKIGGDYGDYELRPGIMNPNISSKIDYRDNDLLPMITTGTKLTHNGQTCGVVDSFGMGIKTYSDIRYRFDGKKEYLEVVDPYKTKTEYVDDNDKEFTTIEFNRDQNIISVPKAYIGANDFPTKTKSGVFYNAEYFKDKNATLLDNAGIPKNNLIKDYVDDDSFKGNAGYRSESLPRFGKSVYFADTDSIKATKKATTGYFLSGYTSEGKLVNTREESENENPNHISKLFSVGIDGSIKGSYRSRMLVNENTVYHINKNDGYKNDQAYFNSRIHFLIFDTERNTPTVPSISTQWVEVEVGKVVKFNFGNSSDTVSVNNVDSSCITVDTSAKTISGLKVGKTQFDLTVKSGSNSETTITIYVNVIEVKPVTKMTINKTNLSLTVGDIDNIIVTTEANSITYDSDGLDLFTFSPGLPSEGSINCSLMANAPGSTTIYITAKVEDKESNTIAINLSIKARTETKYTLEPTEVSFTKSEITGSYLNNTLFKKVKLTENSLIGSGMLGLWSETLKGKRFLVNPDYTFTIDFGVPSAGQYEIGYIAQQDADFSQGTTLPETKPETNPSNKNKIIEGKIIVTITEDE